MYFELEFQPKIKITKFGTKILLNGYLGWNFRKLVSYLKSIFCNLLTCNVSFKNKKILNFELYLGIFGLKFNKNYYQIFNQYSRICETIEFHKKKKLRTENPLFAFSAGIFMNYCHICNQHPPFCLIQNFVQTL